MFKLIKLITKIILRLNDKKPLKELVSVWIQKTCGILLKEQKDTKPRTLFVKPNHVDKAIMIKI
jgi:hypothetical protein